MNIHELLKLNPRIDEVSSNSLTPSEGQDII